MAVIVKTVKLSSKGQLTLPAEVVRALRARRGSEFLLVQDGARVVLTPAADAGRRIVDDLKGMEALAGPAFSELWDNPADEAWNEV